MAASPPTNRAGTLALAFLAASVLWAAGALSTAYAYNYGLGSYGAGAYNVGQLDPTTTTLTSGTNPTTFGSGTTLTATVSPSSATGTVTFRDGSTTIGTATLGHGSGTLTLSSLSVGSHSLTAVYGGNVTNSGSTSNTLTQTVNPAATSTVLTSSLNPSTYGSGVTLRGFVSPSSATGTITFKDGSTILGTVTLGHGSGFLAVSTLTAGSHSLTAVYAGNSTYLTSTSNTVTQVVNKASTTTVLVSSLNPSSFGSGTRLTATVSPSSATGTLTFKDGATTIGTVTLGHGSGTLTVSNLSVATHSLTAVYGGNSTFLTSTSNTISQVVNKASTTTVLVSSLNPSTFGSGITLTAAVIPSSATGTITFKDGATTIGSVTLGHGSGSLVTSTLSAGSHSLTVVYAGNSTYLTSTSNTVSQVVNKAVSTTVLVSSLNPSTFGSGITLTATVSPSSATGTITFKDGATTIGSVTLGHGSGALTVSNLSVATHSLTAIYGGNTNFLTSTSNTVSQVVNQAAATTTTTALVSSTNPTTFGDSTTLTATVTPSSATGTVTFRDGGTTVGTVTLGQGSGSIAISSLSVGSHALTAVYAGNSTYGASTSNTITQTVNAASSAASSSSSLITSGGGGGGGGGGDRRGLSVPASSSQSSTSATSDSSSSRSAAEPDQLTLTVEGKAVTYHDVPVSAWFAPYVRLLLLNGIVSGYRDADGRLTGAFGPANPVTEAEILKMALLAGKKAIDGSAVPVNPSAQGDWSAPYVKLAEDLGLSVYTVHLNVQQPATRGEVVETVLEVLGIPANGSGDNPFADLSADHPHAAALLTAWRLGIITGDTDAEGNLMGTVRPDDSINRAEAAKIIAVVFQHGPYAPIVSAESSSGLVGNTARVAADVAYLHVDARVQSAVAGVLHQGDLLTVLRIVDVWAQVRLDSGLEGYVGLSKLDPLAP